jgi:two-component system sensor histidine kinase/response regulator
MSATPATILVVDDNEANRALAREALEDEGYRVLPARDGKEGLLLFEEHRPDCVLLDVRMPEMDGFAACERIRALPHGAETPVLFLTAQRDLDTFDRALRAGGDDFLSKPIRPTELVIRVQSALKLRDANITIRENLALLKKQRDDLQRLQLQRERLSAFVVHDLKTPLNTIELYGQILMRDAALPARARECATEIRTAARRLNNMVLNLLDISRADEGQLSPRRSVVALAPLVAEVLSDLGLDASTCKVSLRSALSADSIHVDLDLFRRTLTNLVENAIRYAPPGTEVTVTAARVSDATEIRVADAGKGIAPELRERVFSPFVQVDAGDRAVVHGNRGLGLTFCKMTVEAHFGRIWIEDAAPGAVFCVSIPHGT